MRRAQAPPLAAGVAEGLALPPVAAPADLLPAFRRYLVPLFGALNLAAFEAALTAACRGLVGCSCVSILTFQRHGRQAWLRFTTHPDLAPHADQLMPFDEGALSAALLAGLPAEADAAGPLVWSTLEGGVVVSALALRPLAFEDEPYGAILFHDLGKAEALAEAPAGPRARSARAVWLDLIAQAASLALVKCELDEERARQVLGSRVRLAAITRMGRVLNTLDLDVLLRRIMDVALSAVNGQVGSVVLAREGQLETVAEWGLEHGVVESIHYPSGRTVMEEVYQTKLPILLVEPAKSDRVRVDRRDVAIDSYLCVPLSTSRGPLGVLNIINSASGHSFSDRDMDLLLTICNLASAAVENAVLHEEAMAKERMDTQLEIASTIQKGLLPEAAPSVPDLDLAGWNSPCEAVGGDYFDFVVLADGRIAVVIGDVSGHGIGPALLMSSARAALRSFIASRIGPEEIMVHLNRLLTSQVLTAGNFLTMVFAVVNARERNLIFSNAGHPPPLVFNVASRSIREPAERGMLLGVDPEADYSISQPIPFERGDILALYTDGVVDVTNQKGEPFGKQRLAKCLVANRDLAAREIINAIRAEIAAFCGNLAPADDLTLVMAKIV